MVLIVLVGAAYAGYRASHSGELELAETEIDLEGKTPITLLPIEQMLGLLEAPISTITYFDGNYKVAAEHLQGRMKEILAANPWLGGWLAKAKGEKEVKLWYDPTGEQIAPGWFHAFEPGVIKLMEDTPYDKYSELGKDNPNPIRVKVPKTQDIVGKNEALWRVTLVPFADRPKERFALVMSMSHAIADGHTYYYLYNMLSKDEPVVAMNPRRRLEFSGILMDHVGKEEAFYIKNATSNPMWEWRRAGTDPMEKRMFHISEDWLRNLQGSFDMGDDEEERSVSINSILTSWFFHTFKPTIGLMVFNYRDRLPMCRVSLLDAGNYQNPITYTEADYATPELIQQSLEGMKRCGSDPPAPLPGFQWDATFSITTNWATFLWNQMNVGNDIKETLHLPLYDPKDLDFIPNKLSLMNIFTACSGSQDSNEKRRLGALIVAPRSIIREIESCGIVEEMIAQF